MSLLSAISHIGDEYRQARSRYVTEREIGSLPREIQKDIGWPVDQASRRLTINPAWYQAK
jgi:hypothetical protein